MYEELINKLRELPHLLFVQLGEHEDVVYQAADAIEELQKDLERSKDFESFWQQEAEEALRKYQVAISRKPQWIPVTERLPDNIDEEVLVCNEGYGKDGTGFATVAVYNGSGWLECWERKTYLTAVTHWMPLPEPPKEGE